MTDDQRKTWARSVVKYDPPTHLYSGLTYAEAELRAKELFTAAAQLGVWTHLPNHLTLIHNEMLKRSKQ